MKQYFLTVLKRAWILPVTYVVVCILKWNDKYPTAFLLTVTLLFITMCVYDYRKKKRKAE